MVECSAEEMPKPIYTIKNCRFAYQLNWSVALFWNSALLDPKFWVDELKTATQPDGVRILDYSNKDEKTSLLLVSTLPGVAPPQVVRSLKGRLQHLVLNQRPKAFRRNYSILSVGASNQRTLEGYLDGQLQRHPMADPRVQARFARYQVGSSVDLATPRRSSHGQYIYNLHIVLVRRQRHRISDEGSIARVRAMILRASNKKGHFLRKAAVVSDHIHLALGADLNESPAEVALGYLNNVAYIEGLKPVFQFGAYLGTFGEYDRGAIRSVLEKSNDGSRRASLKTADSGPISASVCLPDKEPPTGPPRWSGEEVRTPPYRCRRGRRRRFPLCSILRMA